MLIVIFMCVKEFLDRRKMTEFGSLALVEEQQDDTDGRNISLPGVRKGDMSSRHWKPEVRVSSIRFSPTGQLRTKWNPFLEQWKECQCSTSSFMYIMLCTDTHHTHPHTHTHTDIHTHSHTHTHTHTD